MGQVRATGARQGTAHRGGAALAAGPDVVYQGALRSGNWGGWSDFLERVERPSDLGAFSYEVTDTKLKRRPSPKHVLQLVVYSDLLAKVQGVEPQSAHVQLGNGNRETLRLSDFSAYARAAKARLEAFVAAPRSTRPVPCSDCDLCRWADHCAEVWKSEDSLFNVANISKVQVKKLAKSGITTMAALAGHQGPVRGMAGGTLERLKVQSRLQNARKMGAPAFEVRSPVPGKGFGLLPKPQEGDIFYDIEGDPHYDGGLEYLHGVWASGAFTSFWAHDHGAEAETLSDLLEFFRKRLTEFPHARIYHYAPYEITALRRLTGKYGIGEVFLDRLLREGRFVDLYAVVRGGVVCSEANYSIKSLEIFYGLNREGEVKTAGGSVVAYEKWRETGDDQILREIEQYNRVDCESTERLRDWLLSIRPEGPWPQPGEDRAPKEAEEDREIASLREKLTLSGLSEERQTALFNLSQFHRREAKPAWWAVFDSLAKDEDALIDDLDALGGLFAVGPGVPVKQSIARTYRFPAQETKLRAGKRAAIPTPDGLTTIAVEALDRRKREVTLKIGAGRADLLSEEMTLHPEPPLQTKVIAAAIQDVIADQCGPKRYRAVDDLLSRTPPRLTDGSPILAGSDLVAGTIAAVRRMDETVLPIQG
ncbi:MAG: TM0106 family RecB-like putative nuclease, partial [Blastocatellia bacterium]